MEQTAPFDVQITYPTPFPGTPFYLQLKNQGRLLEERAWEKCTLFDINFRPQRMSPAELRAGFFDLAAKLYSDDATEFRRAAFRQRRQHKATEGFRDARRPIPS